MVVLPMRASVPQLQVCKYHINKHTAIYLLFVTLHTNTIIREYKAIVDAGKTVSLIFTIFLVSFLFLILVYISTSMDCSGM